MKIKVFLGAFIFIVCNSASLFAAALTPPDIAGHLYESAIKYVYNRGIVEGYPDGTYKPDVTLNRAELLKIIVASKFSASEYNPYEGAECFSDIDGSQWYAKYVCFAKERGIIQGYPDGTFRPSNEVIFVEALKIMMEGMGVDPSSLPEDEWYMPYYISAEAYYLVPDELKNQYARSFSRGQAAEVITRILSLDAVVVKPEIYSTEGGYEPGKIYIGYMQWADVLDLYLIADSGISEFEYTGTKTYRISGNNIISFDPVYAFNYTYTASSVSFDRPFTLHTNEIVHVGTAYLDNTNPVSVRSK